MRRRGGRVRPAVPVAAAMAAAVVLTAGLPGGAWAAEPGAAGGYAFAEGIRPVSGAATTSEAPVLDASGAYKDSVTTGAKRVYRLDLDARTNAYVSAVAVPRPGSEVGTFDSLKVSLQDRNGYDCSSNDARFGAAEFPRPVAAYAHRTLDRDSTSCQDAGTYYVVVERAGKDGAPAGEPWDLEIRHRLEPRPKSEGPTAAPENWPSASPPAPAGAPRERAGGAGFHDATGLTEGEWTDRIEPGRSRFYRVPVDWGQQLYASADLGSSAGGGFVGSALAVTLFNPMQGAVSSSESVSYDGKQKSAGLDPMPPVKYENRFDSAAKFEDTRFAGWYYLRVSLSPEVGEEFGEKPYGLTLWISVEGEPQAGPAYDGPPGIFDVTEADQDAAAGGLSVPEAERSGTMRLVAVAGLGTGTALVLGLGAWTLLARRRVAAAGAGPGPGPGGSPGAGPGAGPGMSPPPPGFGPPAW
ncbi:hypothetical protein [Streptomyces sp. NPDC015131]|uniref:hypothetical protein n=1 Tax=Streptomyces sp. NPDC015131 TaxID=3364941 RepID=UPI0036F6BFF7